MASAGRRWSKGDDNTISALYGRIHKTIDTHRDALARMQASGEAADSSSRQLLKKIQQLQAEKLELMNLQAAGPPESELHNQIRELKCELEDCRSRLRRSEMIKADKADELDRAVGRQRELQRDLSGALSELDRLRMELHLLRPLQPQGRPTPHSAPRQEAHPELEPPYSPRYHRPPPPPRPAPEASQALARAISHGKQAQPARHTGSSRDPPPTELRPALALTPFKHDPIGAWRATRPAAAGGGPDSPRGPATPAPPRLSSSAGGSWHAAGGGRRIAFESACDPAAERRAVDARSWTESARGSATGGALVDRILQLRHANSRLAAALVATGAEPLPAVAMHSLALSGGRQRL